MLYLSNMLNFKPMTVLLVTLVKLKDSDCVDNSELKDCGLWYCEKGYDCCGFKRCIPEGNVCCGAGYFYCRSGQTCCGIIYCCRAGYYCDSGDCKRATVLTTRWKKPYLESTTRQIVPWSAWVTARPPELFTTPYQKTTSVHIPWYVYCLIPLAIVVCIVIVKLCRLSRTGSRRRRGGEISLTYIAVRPGQIPSVSNNASGVTGPSDIRPYSVATGWNRDTDTTNTNDVFSQPPPAYEDVMKDTRYQI